MTTPDDESTELVLEMLEDATRTPESGRVCESCGYPDPSMCAMTCPMCESRHPGMGVHKE